jgi:hypothetical protein
MKITLDLLVRLDSFLNGCLSRAVKTGEKKLSLKFKFSRNCADDDLKIKMNITRNT